ncbi:MAG: asparagine synthase-related protein [Clostridia bacterium]|nr:asparagine synthase-related protein [Clostridia bacterium]
MNQWIVIKKRTSEPALSFSRAAEGFCRMDCGSVLAFFRKDSRFVNDQVFCADDGSLIISDGVLLNLRELTAQYHAADLRQVIDALCAEDPSAYFSAFIGPFCGAKYDRRTDTLIAYGNQTGDAPVFYFQNERCFMVSNDLNLIEQVMADNHFPRTLDETAAQYLLTFAYMIDDRTLFREIRRLLPGDALMLCGADCKIVPYHRFSFDPLDISMEDAIELVDQKFRKAVDRCFSKDAEYGCPTHLVDLSGGMDSRMTAWVAHDLGYRSNIYINYCQYGSDELRCASRVANELGGQLFYKQLDDASFLYEVDRLIERGGGLPFCFGSTGSDQFLRLLDAAQFGLEHTGQIGDAVLGSFGTQHTELTQSAVESLKYSRTLPFSLVVQFLCEL